MIGRFGETVHFKLELSAVVIVQLFNLDCAVWFLVKPKILSGILMQRGIKYWEISSNACSK